MKIPLLRNHLLELSQVENGFEITRHCYSKFKTIDPGKGSWFSPRLKHCIPLFSKLSLLFDIGQQPLK
jgi:hypothetical protein